MSIRKSLWPSDGNIYSAWLTTILNLSVPIWFQMTFHFNLDLALSKSSPRFCQTSGLWNQTTTMMKKYCNLRDCFFQANPWWINLFKNKLKIQWRMVYFISNIIKIRWLNSSQWKKMIEMSMNAIHWMNLYDSYCMAHVVWLQIS